jgi:hypothetical protein
MKPTAMPALPRVTALTAAMVVAACALAAAGSAAAAQIGANDDTPKFDVVRAGIIFGQMKEADFRQIVLTVRWAPSDPLAIPSRKELDAVIPLAAEHGVRVVFAAYPYPAADIEAGRGGPAGFASWLTALATAYPQVRQYVVLNEPNQPAFVRPQFDRKGKNVSAALAGRFLAASYDALKAVDPEITVLGLGLSPRGNDRPKAKSNVSTSPIRFLKALGEWYRTSGRTLPIMDGLSFHPYPNTAKDPLERGYPWPNAGYANLERIKQAIWDAFDGTGQPTTVDGLKLYLDEVGWQVDTEGRDGYQGTENVAVTDELTQAGIYRKLTERAVCDPEIAELNFFGFHDDPLRTGFQAALHRVDGTARPAFDAVKQVMGERAFGCLIPSRAWRPALNVVGVTRPPIVRAPGVLKVDVSAAEGATAIVCAFPGRLSRSAVRSKIELLDATSPECAEGALRQNKPAKLRVPRPFSGPTTVGIRIVAESNADRVTLLSRWL